MYIMCLVDVCRMEPPRFEPGTIVLWTRTYKNVEKTFKVKFVELVKDSDGERVKIKVGNKSKSKQSKSRFQIVATESLTPISSEQKQSGGEPEQGKHQPQSGGEPEQGEHQPQLGGEQKQGEPPQPSEPPQPIFSEQPVGWVRAQGMFLKEYDRFGVRKFNSKVLEVMQYFWTKNVRGDGWCLLHAVNELIDMYGLAMHRYTKDDLRRIAREKQPNYDDSWSFDSKTGKTTKYILAAEVVNPLNLSEAWVAFLAKELNCRFIVFTVQFRVDHNGGKTEDVCSFTARKVLPYQGQEYSKTFYLYNTGHYWPLLPEKNFKVEDLIKQWGNETFKKAR